MVNIRNQLTTLFCRGKLCSDCQINSSNFTFNFMLLSDQQVAQMCNFGRKD